MIVSTAKARSLKQGDTINTPSGKGIIGHLRKVSYEIPARTVEAVVMDVTMEVGIDGNKGQLVQTVQCWADDEVPIMRKQGFWSRLLASLKRTPKATSTEVAAIKAEFNSDACRVLKGTL